MKNVLRFILPITLLMLGACGDDSPFVSKQEAEKKISDLNNGNDPFHAVTDVVAIISNDIYYFKRLDTVPVQLTNTPNIEKRNIVLSPDHSMIAYLTSNGSPVLISASSGDLIKALTQYTYVVQMDFSKTDNTLYLLYNNSVVTYGGSLDIIQPEILGPYDQVYSFSMNAIGDQGYYILHTGDFSKVLEFHSTSQAVDTEYGGFDGYAYDYVDFYNNKGDFMVASENFSDGGYSKMICITGYSGFASYTWEASMSSMAFNGDHEILLYGSQENGLYQVTGVYLGSAFPDAQFKVLDAYTSTTPIYLDWVQ